MTMACVRILVALALSTSVLGCLNKISANLTPGSRVPAQARYHVLSSPDAGDGVDRLVQQKLLAMNFNATVGARETMPPETDVLVTYRDKWMWDITMYMLELTVTLRKPHNDFPLAEGHAMHGSLTRRSPEEMVDEVLSEIFRKVQAGG